MFKLTEPHGTGGGVFGFLRKQSVDVLIAKLAKTVGVPKVVAQTTTCFVLSKLDVESIEKMGAAPLLAKKGTAYNYLTSVTAAGVRLSPPGHMICGSFNVVPAQVIQCVHIILRAVAEQRPMTSEELATHERTTIEFLFHDDRDHP